MLRKLPVTFARLLVSPPPPLASTVRRHVSSSSSTPTTPGLTGGMKEFFASSTTGDKQVVGRSWHASELRVKSFNDLHCLWFVCLKERNYLLSERLYYRQMQQAAPEGGRLHKVKKTMAAIKVVIGERARAAKAMEADLERAKVAAALEGALSGRGEETGAGAGGVDTPVETLEEEKNRTALERRKQLMDVRGVGCGIWWGGVERGLFPSPPFFLFVFHCDCNSRTYAPTTTRTHTHVLLNPPPSGACDVQKVREKVHGAC